LKILGNEEVIAINQDSLGIQASRIRRDVKTEGTFEVWGGDLSNNRYVVVFFNRGELDSLIEVDIRN
jgi:alpha-galactosidase